MWILLLYVILYLVYQRKSQILAFFGQNSLLIPANEFDTLNLILLRLRFHILWKNSRSLGVSVLLSETVRFI